MAFADGEADWSGRSAFSATVGGINITSNTANTANTNGAADILSLDGTWEFMTRPVDFASGHCMDPDAEWTDSREICVPGCWEAQGVGKGPAESTEWDYYRSRSVTGQTALLRNVYNGNAWYRKRIDVPTEWAGQKIWLAVGGVRSVGWFYVNGERAALVDSFCGTYKYDVTDLVKPGEVNLVAVRVRNDLPSRKGLMSYLHAWGGLYRSVELQMTPKIRLEETWCRGDLDAKNAEIHCSVRRDLSVPAPKSTDDYRVEVVLFDREGREVSRASQSAEVTTEDSSDETVISVPVPDLVPWSPENPHRYRAEISLRLNDQTLHTRTEHFGIRKLEVRGDRFYLNNEPFFFRMFGDDWIYFDTLTSPADIDAHREHLQKARDAGFNSVRLHTHCELPEYFEAADELGILIQAELPYFGEFPADGFDFNPKRDLAELHRHYRRYASLGIYCMGNEGSLGSPLDEELYAFIRENDPDRLVLHQDGGANRPTKNCDFVSGPTVAWSEPQTQHQVPFIAHEYLNLSVKHDPRWESLFSGVILPFRTMAQYEKELAAAGLDRSWGDACLDAGHSLQKYYQKQGLEAARLDPTCDGYCFWTIVDTGAPDRGVATSQGLFSPFWTVKSGGSTPESFRVFNQSSVLLAKIEGDRKIFVAGEQIVAACFLSHFGEKARSNVRVRAELVLKVSDGTSGSDGSGIPEVPDTAALASAELSAESVAVGEVHELGGVTFDVPEFEHPMPAVLRLTDGETGDANSWDIWLFPKRGEISGQGLAVSPEMFDVLSKRYPGAVRADSPEAKDAAIILGNDQDAAEGLESGQSAILLDPPGGAPNVSLGWWWLGDQTGTAMKTCPAFSDFPHSGTLDPLWFRILKKGDPLVDGSPWFGAEHFVVGEGVRHYFAHLGQLKADKGKLLFVRGIDLLSDYPEGVWLLDQLVRYARSDAFEPLAQNNALTQDYFDRQRVAESLNGWSETLVCGQTFSGKYFFGPGTIATVFFDGKSSASLEWLSAIMNDNFPNEEAALTWLCGFGKRKSAANPDPNDVRFDGKLFLNQKEVLAFSLDGSRDKWEVTDGGVQLRWETLRQVGQEKTGLMTLTVPHTLLQPGTATRIRLKARSDAADCWLGVLEYAGPDR